MIKCGTIELVMCAYEIYIIPHDPTNYDILKMRVHTANTSSMLYTNHRDFLIPTLDKLATIS